MNLVTKVELEERRDRVDNAIANVELEGMKLSERGYEMAEKYARGEISKAVWDADLRRRMREYMRRASS